MSEHFPRIRVRAQNGYLLIREGLTLTFYMKRAHSEIAAGVMRSLEAYLRAVGPSALDLYADEEGEWQPLDARGWDLTRRELLHPEWAGAQLRDSSTEERYRFEYQGLALDDPSFHWGPEEVSVVSYWLPSEFLEERGPGQLRELALELAAPLPFNSGRVGLAFNCEIDLLGVNREVRRYCLRYPGLDIGHPSGASGRIGTRVEGPSWLTFLGQPVLGELGGAAGLRSRLHTPGTTVQELDGDRAVVTLGPWPEAGDTEQGKTLPAWRELARVLEPWTLWGEGTYMLGFDPEDAPRWERRFLD